MNSGQSEKITSTKNPRIQFLRTLLTEKSTRIEQGLFIAEGIRLSEEVLHANIIPHSVFYTDAISARGGEIIQNCRDAGVDCYLVSAEVMNKVSDTETAQGILMVIPQTAIPVPDVAEIVLILDQLRDPGNCGTILRTASAVGVQLVFTTLGSADLFMPKVVRAGMGAHFRMCIRQANWDEILEYCKPASGKKLNIFLAESGNGQNLWKANLKEPLALIIGGEAEGASQTARNIADSLIHIPMPGQLESLNAGVAASILLFEILRQRTQ